MSVNVGLDGRGRYHKRWTAFGLGCGAFKLPWGPFFDAHISHHAKKRMDFITGLSIVRNIEDMHVLEWFGGLIFLVCFVSMVKTLFRNDLKTREI